MSKLLLKSHSCTDLLASAGETAVTDTNLSSLPPAVNLPKQQYVQFWKTSYGHHKSDCLQDFA